MSDTSANSHRCPQCGTPLPEMPGGPCPRCLMMQLVEPTEGDGLMAAQAPFAPEELAPLFPQLEIMECLGRGGMGVVYKARQKSLNRFVALKLLAPERAEDTAFASRFEKEAQALAALNHPNIVAVHDFGEAGGFFFLLMEFVDGVNLRQLLRSKRLTPQEALSIVPPVCDALQCAHERGIVHRDIKPENLLLDRAGTVKIADFGIAKMLGSMDSSSESAPCGPLAMPTTETGTPAYAAPEQRGGPGTADHRADIYSLGVVLYEMLTGERPKDKIAAPSRRVQVDVRIDEIVLRALETKPELRFATVAEFRTQVEAVRSAVAPAPRWSPMKWAAVILASLAAAALAYSTMREAEPKPGSSSTPVALPPAPTLAEAVTQFQANYAELLRAERVAAVDITGAEGHARRLRELQARSAELERLVEELSAPATRSNTKSSR